MKKLQKTLLCGVFVSGLLCATAYAETACDNPVYEGFGAHTPGGKGQPVYHVTNLHPSGPGSLRQGLSQGNRCIVFDVGGDINLLDTITIREPFITIDGFSAPTPVTIKNFGLYLMGINDPFNTGGNAHDIIIRGMRFHPTDNSAGADVDSISVNYGAYNVVIDHNTFFGPLSEPYGAPDEHVDIGSGSHDVTVSWNLLFRRPGGGITQNLLVNAKATRASLHHNLLSDATDKNPIIVFDFNSTAVDTDTTADFRNNYVVAKAGGEGADFGDGANMNIVNNYFTFLPAERPAVDAYYYPLLIMCNRARMAALGNPPYVDYWCNSVAIPENRRHDGYAYIAGNVTPESVPPRYPQDMNVWSTERSPYPAPPVSITDATTAACQVRTTAGRRPLDAQEQRLLDRVPVPVGCSSSSLPPPPTAAQIVPKNLRLERR